ncbi:MAG TPA: insulinase family protein [Fimbriimonadaceae bacterium]|nr:insulinase family protein [Fimbriimonadaceae bacterium]
MGIRSSVLGWRVTVGASVLAICAGVTAQDSPRLRTILPSGSIVYAENMPQARYLSVQLVASASGVRETAESHGLRHMLEHILAKGPDKSLDLRLETQGLFLTAETHRDAMIFSIVGPTEKLELALAAVRDLLQPLKTDAAEIQREVKILAEELALSSPSMRMSKAAWAASYGAEGLDPVGNVEGWSKATPEKLEFLRRRHFAAQNLVISICGNLDVDIATRAARALLPKERDPFEPDPSRRTIGRSANISEANGSARAAACPGWDDPETAALLAAGLALSGERDQGFMIYTPSVMPGLITVGDHQDGIGAWIDGLNPAQIDGMFGLGRAAADAWVRRKLESPETNAHLRGFLYAQNREATPEAMLENIRSMTLVQFRAAIAKFRGGKN